MYSQDQQLSVNDLTFYYPKDCPVFFNQSPGARTHHHRKGAYHALHKAMSVTSMCVKDEKKKKGYYFPGTLRDDLFLSIIFLNYFFL